MSKKMTNADFIEKYKNDNVIIAKPYAIDNVDIEGIVNPLKIDNRQLCSPTDQQGSTPHCAGFSGAQYIESLYWKETGTPIQIEASQIYAKAKLIDGMKDIDGTTPTAVLSAAIGLCGWEDKGYNVDIYFKESKEKTIEYIKYLIHKNMFILIGFNICEGWYKVTNEKYKVTHSGENLGGHCVLGCGYNKEGFYIQNSWGKDWGAKGFALIPWNVFIKEFMYCAWLSK